MRIVIFSAFPLLDRHPYKRRLLASLLDQEYVEEVAVVYGYSGLLESARVAKRLYTITEGIRRLKSSGGGDSSERMNDARASMGPELLEEGSLSSQASKLQTEVKRFDRFGDAACLKFLAEWQPDVGFNLSGLYIPEAVYSLPEKGVFGGHFAELPRIRGADTVRWTVMLDQPMIVSHQVLSQGYDLGDVVLRSRVTVNRGDTIGDIRAKCREVHADGCLEVVASIQSGQLVATPQSELEGSHFRKMGKHLEGAVDRTLKLERYSHYAD